MAVIKYYVWCVTENKFITTYSATEPTVCPTNASHTIDTRRIRTDLLKYQVFCDTEDEYVTAWAYAGEAVPVRCPNDPAGLTQIPTHILIDNLTLTGTGHDPAGRNKKEGIEKTGIEGKIHGYSWKWCPYADESYVNFPYEEKIPDWLPRWKADSQRTAHSGTGGKMSLNGGPRPGFICWDDGCYYYTTITLSGARYIEV